MFLQREYSVGPHEVTSLKDIDLLATYLQENIKADVELEDTDIGVLNSQSSTVWILTVRKLNALYFIRKAVLLISYKRTIILRHSDAGRRLHCLHCGTIDNTIARSGKDGGYGAGSSRIFKIDTPSVSSTKYNK